MYWTKKKEEKLKKKESEIDKLKARIEILELENLKMADNLIQARYELAGNFTYHKDELRNHYEKIAVDNLLGSFKHSARMQQALDAINNIDNISAWDNESIEEANRRKKEMLLSELAKTEVLIKAGNCTFNSNLSKGKFEIDGKDFDNNASN